MPRFRFAPPPLDRPSRVPLGLAAVLALAAAFQLLAGDPAERDLPEPPPVGASARVFVPPPAPPGDGAAVVARAMFAPVAGGAGGAPGTPGAAAAPVDPLAGVAIAGSIRVGRASYAVVQRGARVARVPLGGGIAGFRLRALLPEGAVLTRGGERRVVPYGSGGAAAAPPPGEEQ